MRKSMIILMAASILSATMAEEAAKETKESKELNSAKAEYNAQVNAAVQPIKTRYLAKLDALKKQFGSQGKIEEAMLVQKEIDGISKKTDPGINKEIDGQYAIKYKNGATRELRIKNEECTVITSSFGGAGYKAILSYDMGYDGYVWQDDRGIFEVLQFDKSQKLTVLRFENARQLPPSTTQPEMTATGKRK
jgi:hypothetical protein